MFHIAGHTKDQYTSLYFQILCQMYLSFVTAKFFTALCCTTYDSMSQIITQQVKVRLNIQLTRVR